MAVRTALVDWAALPDEPADATEVGPADATDVPGVAGETVDPQPDTAKASARKMAPPDR